MNWIRSSFNDQILHVRKQHLSIDEKRILLVFDLISVGLRDRYVAFGAGGKIQHVIEHWLTFDVFAVVNWKERYDFFSACHTHKIECNNSHQGWYYSMS